MANAIYPKFKEQVLQAGINMSSLTIKACLARSAVYTYDGAHDYYDDVTSPHATKSDALGTKTFTNGVFDSADSKFTAPASDGNSYNQLILINDTGTAGTSHLIAFYDTGVTGFPVTPNGGDINITVNGSGWFAL